MLMDAFSSNTNVLFHGDTITVLSAMQCHPPLHLPVAHRQPHSTPPLDHMTSICRCHPISPASHPRQLQRNACLIASCNAAIPKPRRCRSYQRDGNENRSNSIANHHRYNRLRCRPTNLGTRSRCSTSHGKFPPRSSIRIYSR